VTDEFPERFGAFTLVHQLGAGGMGTVYLALHPDSEQLLVLKRMHPELLNEQSILKRFIHEAEVATHVRHPNVAQVVAMGTVDKEPFFATEFVFGIQLSKIIDRIEGSNTPPIPLRVGLHLAVELARAVEAIHSARHLDTGAQLGLIHRDVGARNAMVGFDGHLRLIDLGLGKSILSDWQTAHQMMAGSPDYMPPEQAMGGRVDARADVYSCAVTIWELIAGKKRIREEGIAARITRAIGAQPEPLRPLRPEASVRLEGILQHAMHPDPDRRTPTATMLRKTLEEELARLGKKVPDSEIVEWLDFSCATIIAKERRIVDDAVAKGRTRQGEVRAKTEFFFGQSGGKLTLPKAYAYYEPRSTNDRQPALREQTNVGEPIGVLAALLDPQAFRRASWTVKATLIGGAIVIPALLATVTVFLLGPRGPEVSPIESVDAAVIVDADTAKVIEPPVEEPEDPIDLGEARPDSGVVIDKSEGVDEPIRVSPEVSARKEALVTRIRLLRKRRFDLPWQRKVTTLGTRLSRARSGRELDDIEGSLRRMEREL
jgi:serine/threonine protein kinase